MNTGILPTDLLGELAWFISSSLGLHFSEARYRDLERAVLASARDLDFEDPTALATAFLSGELSPGQMETLIDDLTIGETYFLRDGALFKGLESTIIPGLVRVKGRGIRIPRIWCAGCATGEEPYSVAMAVHRSMGGVEMGQAPILATDINQRFLEKAKRGIYGEWSFRRAPGWVKEQYFVREAGGTYRISNLLNEMVQFSKLNLVDGGFPSARTGTENIDLILCRNVLMYFAEEARTQVLDHLVQSLAPGGWLFVSASESPILKHPWLETVRFRGFSGFRRGAQENRERLRPLSAQTRQTPAGPPAPPMAAQEPPPRKIPLEDTPWPELLVAVRPLMREGEYRQVLSLLLDRAQTEGKASGWSGIPVEVPFLLARCHANLGELEEARNWCLLTLRLQEPDVGHHLLLAGLQQELGQSEASHGSLRKALLLDPDSVIARFQMGLVCKRNRMELQAMRWLEGAAELLADLDPEEVLPHSEGILAEDLSDLTGALLKELSR